LRRYCPAEIKFFGRSGAALIGDRVLMAIGTTSAAASGAAWSCDSDEAVTTFDERGSTYPRGIIDT